MEIEYGSVTLSFVMPNSLKMVNCSVVLITLSNNSAFPVQYAWIKECKEAKTFNAWYCVEWRRC